MDTEKAAQTAGPRGSFAPSTYADLAGRLAEQAEAYRAWSEAVGGVEERTAKASSALADACAALADAAEEARASASSPRSTTGAEAEAWTRSCSEMARIAEKYSVAACSLADAMAEELAASLAGMGCPVAPAPKPDGPREDVSFRVDTRLFTFAAKRHAKAKKALEAGK